jgi:oligopeptide/dipeptide ABC transporter ATP-binding protein
MTSLSILRLVPKPTGRIIGGKILFDGQDLLTLSDDQMRSFRGSRISMILQEPMTSLNPVCRIGIQIAEAIAIHQKLSKKDLISKTIDMLRMVRIPSPENRVSNYPHELSGGMKQRVVGAISISCRPHLLIADEPTTSLDVTIQAQYLELLKDIQKEMGMALIFITHDFGIVASLCDRVAVMYAGQIIETASVKDIFYRPAHHYTAALIQAVPKLKIKVDQLVSIPGQPPKLDSLPPGCRFADRCRYADEQCRSKEPSMHDVAPNHSVRCWHWIQ